MPLIDTIFPKTVPPPIRIYEASETAFTGNGLRCLIPESAEVTLKQQQAHTIHMVHPLDEEGAWKTLQLSRILYVPIKRRGEMTFQPMRICKIQKQRQSGGKLSIIVDANHVFYDLNSVIIDTCTISAAACQSAIDSVFNAIYEPTANTQASAAFSYSSDINTAASAEYEHITVTAALIGNDNSIATLYGAELFADGFRFSLNSRMEGALDNAFDLAYGDNLVGITATYSTENTYSAVVGQSGISEQTLVRTMDPATISLPFDRTIFAKFSYQSGTPAQKFSDDMDAYAADVGKVSASYQVTFADLPQTDDYMGFRNLATYEVGDTGRVYDVDLDIDTVQKIVEKKIDVLTQTAISATLGSIPASITQPKQYANTITHTMTADEKAQSILDQKIARENAIAASLSRQIEFLSLNDIQSMRVTNGGVLQRDIIDFMPFSANSTLTAANFATATIYNYKSKLTYSSTAKALDMLRVRNENGGMITDVYCTYGSNIGAANICFGFKRDGSPDRAYKAADVVSGILTLDSTTHFILIIKYSTVDLELYTYYGKLIVT